MELSKDITVLVQNLELLGIFKDDNYDNGARIDNLTLRDLYKIFNSLFRILGYTVDETICNDVIAYNRVTTNHLYILITRLLKDHFSKNNTLLCKYSDGIIRRSALEDPLWMRNERLINLLAILSTDALAAHKPLINTGNISDHDYIELFKERDELLDEMERYDVLDVIECKVDSELVKEIQDMLLKARQYEPISTWVVNHLEEMLSRIIRPDSISRSISSMDVKMLIASYDEALIELKGFRSKLQEM